MGNSDNIIFKHSLKEYESKYKNRKYRLIKLTKKEVEYFDKQYNRNGEHVALKGRKWWFINDTYYEIPRPIRLTWFRNLNGGIQAATCLLAAGAVGAGIAVPLTLLKAPVSNEIIAEETGDASEIIEPVKFSKNSSGDLEGAIKFKSGKTIEDIDTFIVKVDNVELKEDQYSIKDDKLIIKKEVVKSDKPKIEIKITKAAEAEELPEYLSYNTKDKSIYLNTQATSIPKKLEIKSKYIVKGKTVTVEKIASEAFSQLTILEEVVLPNSIIEIGQDAFIECSALTSVTFGSELKTIGKDSFNGCINLINFKLPEKLEIIGQGAFYSVASKSSTPIENIDIPASVIQITDHAFGSAKVKNITFKNTKNWTKSGATKELDEELFKDQAYVIKQLVDGERGTWCDTGIEQIGKTPESVFFKAYESISAAFQKSKAIYASDSVTIDGVTATKVDYSGSSGTRKFIASSNKGDYELAGGDLMVENLKSRISSAKSAGLMITYDNDPTGGIGLTISDPKVGQTIYSVTINSNGYATYLLDLSKEELSEGVAVTYTGDPVEPITPKVTKIQVTKNPTKTTYTVGEKLNLDGLAVTATLVGGGTRELDSSEYKTNPSTDTALTVDITSVNVILLKDETIKDSFTITVTEGKELYNVDWLTSKEGLGKKSPCNLAKLSTKIVFGTHTEYDETVKDLTIKDQVGETTNDNITAYFDDTENAQVLYVLSDKKIAFNDDDRPEERGLFSDSKALASIEFKNVDMSQTTRMMYMFSSCTALTSLDLSSFDTSNVEYFDCMFSSCTKLLSINLSSFNTSKAKSMGSMFNAVGFIDKVFDLDLSSFDTSNVTNTSSMFANCYRVKNIYVSDKFNMDKVLGQGGSSTDMFKNCNYLTGEKGTTIDSLKSQEDYLTAKYAKVDGGESDPGYLTYKPIELEAGEESYSTLVPELNAGRHVFSVTINSELGGISKFTIEDCTPSISFSGENIKVYVNDTIYDGNITYDNESIYLSKAIEEEGTVVKFEVILAEKTTNLDCYAELASY